MGDVTSRQIMSAAGIANVATLIRWHKYEKLIPPPEIRTHPNGRGKMAFWPEWVLQRCVQIKQLRKEGQSLTQIREFLGSDWEAAANQLEPQPKRRYRFAEASRRIDEDAALTNLRRRIAHFLIDWVQQHQTEIRGTSVSMIASTCIDKAIAMLEQGINPVIVLSDGKAVLTPDFAVSLQLASRRSVDEAVMVIPVRKELSVYLDKLMKVPAQPSIIPCSKVLRKTTTGSETAKVVVMDSWEFALEPRKRRPADKRE